MHPFLFTQMLCQLGLLSTSGSHTHTYITRLKFLRSFSVHMAVSICSTQSTVFNPARPCTHPMKS